MVKLTTEQLMQKYNVTPGESSAPAPAPTGKLSTEQLKQKYSQPSTPSPVVASKLAPTAPKMVTPPSKVFSTPLTNIASGDSERNVEGAKGAAKGVLRTLQDADVLTTMHFLAGDKTDFTGMTKEQRDAVSSPSNEAQQQGYVGEKISELAVPTGEAKAAIGVGSKALGAATEASRVKKATDAVGRVLQGEIKDVPAARDVLSTIERKGINTYQDLVDRLHEKIGIISRTQDKAYEANNSVRTLDNLAHGTTVGGTTVKQNYVKDALDQLENFYTKTNDLPNATRIQQLVEKANTSGLSVKEINNIAREHGANLSGFNASGELASGLSKQAAENTRAGVKATVRDLFGNNLSKISDAELTKLIRVRDLAKDMAEKVNDLSQKIQSRGLGERAGRLIGQAVNLVGLNGPKGFLEYFLGRGTGLKTLNALDLQKQLAKNLKLIQKAADPAALEKDVVTALEQFIKNTTGKLPPLLLPEKAGAAAPKTIFAAPGGKSLSPALQEAVDAAGAASGRVKPPSSAVFPKPLQKPLYEPYGPEGVIDFGKKARPKKASDLPTIR